MRQARYLLGLLGHGIIYIRIYGYGTPRAINNNKELDKEPHGASLSGIIVQVMVTLLGSHCYSKEMHSSHIYYKCLEFYAYAQTEDPDQRRPCSRTVCG